MTNIPKICHTACKANLSFILMKVVHILFNDCLWCVDDNTFWIGVKSQSQVFKANVMPTTLTFLTEGIHV